MRRRGFTLVELLIAISVIAILALLVYGALQRAGGQAKQIHTRSTIAKLHASVVDRWESYRTRRLNIDPMNVAEGMRNGYFGGPYNAILAMANRRIGNSGGTVHAYPTIPYDSLSVLNTGGKDFPSSTQIAAIRLLALRDLQRYEMPDAFSDFADMSGTPGSFQLRAPDVLGTYVQATGKVKPNVPGLAFAYLAALNKATTNNVNQILANQSAECLYMVLTLGTSDNALGGEQPISMVDIGDVDGDGLPEFQDSWPAQNSSFSTVARANAPIDFVRWPAGFISTLQPDPTQPNLVEFSMSHHDFLDPIKLDIPSASSGSPPRGFRMTPLIYSAGPDGDRAIITFGGFVDPYDVSGGQQQATIDPASDHWIDNITNHDLEQR